MRVPRAFVLPSFALILLTTGAPGAWAQERTWEKLPGSGEAMADAQGVKSFVSEFDVSDQAVTFRTKGRYAGYTLKVNGPDRFHLQQRIPGSSVPRLLLRTDTGVLADGIYKLELTAQPLISTEIRASLDSARSTGNDAVIYKALKRAGIDPQAMVYSTAVRVMQGRFLDPTIKEAVGDGSGGQQIDNRGEALDAVRSLPPVLLTGAPADVTDQTVSAGEAEKADRERPVQVAAVSDATHQPGAPRPEFVEGPEVKSAALNQTLAAVQRSALPSFIAAQADPNAPWTQARFQNQAADGTPMALDGYLRPVVAQAYSDEPLIQAYFRQADTDGTGYGPWLAAYFEPTANGGFRLVKRAAVEQPATLFDYTVSETDPVAPMPDQVILDDLIVDGSLCVGLDCVNGESFGFDTVRLKENNLRQHFQDTSTSASFPTVDWRITVNDSSNGGANHFSITQVDQGRTPFRVNAEAPNNALVVDNSIGVGTANPVVEIHVVDGDSPTLRLEQDGSSGFTPQTWDVAGNETNFFVRDATGGSRLPLRIRPGAASNAIFVDVDSDVGLKTSSPQGAFHVENTGGQDSDDFIVTSSGQVGIGIVPAQDLHVGPTTNANAGIRLETASHQWDFFTIEASGIFGLSKVGSAGNQATLDGSGNLVLQGNCTGSGGAGCPDYVFEPDYDLRSLEELEKFIKANKHLPNVPSAAEIEEDGFSVQGFGFALLEKIEELTLYTIEQQKVIAELQARLAALEAERNK